MYKFISIGGNCAGTFFLGKDRVKGPVDNVIVKGYNTIDILFQNKYLDYIKTTTFKQSKRIPNFPGDSAIAYDSSLVMITHNDPTQIKYIESLKIRCNNLSNFLKEVKTNKNFYLIYSLNPLDLDRKTHKKKGNHFVEIIEYLKNQELLNKTIFIGTTKTKNSSPVWNFWSDDLIDIIKKYSLKYLEIDGIIKTKDITKKDSESYYNQFIQKFEDLLANGTNKKYLSKRNNNQKKTDTIKTKIQTKTYLNSNYYGL